MPKPKEGELRLRDGYDGRKWVEEFLQNKWRWCAEFRNPSDAQLFVRAKKGERG
jgi:hypothetical protein